MKTWITFGALFLAGTALGWWGVFTFRFFAGVLPHGGMW